MNTPISGKSLALGMLLVCVLFSTSCRRDTTIFGIDELTILPINSEKNKPKTSAQYISVLYTNLFQKAIGPNNMLSAQKAIESIGDKQIAYDILVSKYMNDPGLVLPSMEEMRADPEAFVRKTYTRFLIRQPTEAELAWMLNYINSRPQVTPELIYFAFATSNEHFHY